MPDYGAGFRRPALFRILTGFLLACSVLFPCAARAQDERVLASPHGQIEFHIFITTLPEDAGLTRLAYTVLYRGKLLIDTSFIGLDILNQEPVLGVNLGLLSSSTPPGNGQYNSMLLQYMQNGSLGRRINIEVRAYDDGIAFRCILPKSTPLDPVLIRDEVTDFAFAKPLLNLHEGLPAIGEEPGIGWIEITGSAAPGYPRLSLSASRGSLLTTHLERSTKDPTIAFEGASPLVWPWRMLVVAPDRDHLASSPIIRDLASD